MSSFDTVNLWGNTSLRQGSVVVDASSFHTSLNDHPIIDLRSPSEYAAKRFEGSINLPWEELENGTLGCELPPRDVIFDLILPRTLDPSTALSYFGATKSKATGEVCMLLPSSFETILMP